MSLINNTCLCLEGQSGIQQRFGITWKQLEAFNKSGENDETCCHGINLQGHHEDLDIYLDSESTLDSWLFYLRPLMICSNIEDDYKDWSKIAEGTGTHIFKATLVENDS